MLYSCQGASSCNSFNLGRCFVCLLALNGQSRPMLRISSITTVPRLPVLHVRHDSRAFFWAVNTMRDKGGMSSWHLRICLKSLQYSIGKSFFVK